MPTPGTVRPMTRDDLSTLRNIVDEALFPGDLLEPMATPYFDDPESPDRWLSYEREGPPVAVAYCVPEVFTEGVFNLKAIATRADLRSHGIGRALMTALEEQLAAEGARLLLVDTSGLPAFDATRRFYLANGYEEEAPIREFWAPGDDKVTFSKKLS